MSWYLRKIDGGVYGPVEIDTLRRWAAEGRISPDDALSEDQANWFGAPDMPQLEMSWMIDLEGSETYGPIHLHAVQELLAEGSLTPQTRLVHKRTGEVRILSDLLAAKNPPSPPVPAAAPVPTAPAEPKAAPEQKRAAPEQKPAAPEQKSVTPDSTSATPTAATTAQPKQVWKELSERRDFFEREMKKWRKMYEDERDNARRREDGLNERIEEFRKNDLANRTLIEQLERKLVQLERNYSLFKQSVEASATDEQGARVMALMESYQQLSEQYDGLMQQLTAKSAEIQGLLESRSQIEKSAEERLRHGEEITRREREEADKARKQLAGMEETHLHLVKAYRELNERFIRRRDQNATAPSPRPAAAAVPAAPPPAPTTEESGRSKVRLNRR